MTEIRCKWCNKLLGTTDYKERFEIEILCPKCKHKYRYRIEAQEAQG
ncbi:Mu-like prophage protein Com [Gottschalkia purinilytica]|uniref:Mu-like prophage protein Com n=1 Tax=Gottschalkia purinilytica TaxID=1503 RepID=A0A0L0W6R3_GOTPU|nr:hypothetical protein [Gottschalkia purinilytica]KNF07151.1 Mu-like prophage protein Com [Gottschalkia purinilytica]